MARKIVKTEQVTVDDREVPKCSKHGEDMTFDVAGGYWHCPSSGCGIRQYPQIELVQAGPAVVGTGALELLLYKDGDGMAAALRARGNNVVMDITPHLVKMFKPKDGETVIMLRVKRVVDTDGFTEKAHDLDG